MIVNHFRIPKQKYEEKRKKQIFSVTLQSLSGGVAEWSMAAVLKTVVPKGTGGSNPSASANEITDEWTLKVYSLKIHSFEFYFVNRIPYTKTGIFVYEALVFHLSYTKTGFFVYETTSGKQRSPERTLPGPLH